MSAVTTSRRARPPGANSSTSRAAPGAISKKRSAPMALAGLTAVVIGAVVFFAAHVGLDRRESVLLIARAVASGQVIAAEDLREAQVSISAGAASVPASQRGEVVGKTATVGLVPGAVLAPAQLGTVAAIQAGEAVVGLALKAGQAPLGLRPGTRVQVVDTGGAGGGASMPAVVSTLAVVVNTGESQPGSGVGVVSLRLPLEESLAVSAAGAAGRATLVVLAAS